MDKEFLRDYMEANQSLGWKTNGMINLSTIGISNLILECLLEAVMIITSYEANMERQKKVIKDGLMVFTSCGHQEEELVDFKLTMPSWTVFLFGSELKQEGIQWEPTDGSWQGDGCAETGAQNCLEGNHHELDWQGRGEKAQGRSNGAYHFNSAMINSTQHPWNGHSCRIAKIWGIEYAGIWYQEDNFQDARRWGHFQYESARRIGHGWCKCARGLRHHWPYCCSYARSLEQFWYYNYTEVGSSDNPSTQTGACLVPHTIMMRLKVHDCIKTSTVAAAELVTVIPCGSMGIPTRKGTRPAKGSILGAVNSGTKGWDTLERKINLLWSFSSKERSTELQESPASDNANSLNFWTDSKVSAIPACSKALTFKMTLDMINKVKDRWYRRKMGGVCSHKSNYAEFWCQEGKPQDVRRMGQCQYKRARGSGHNLYRSARSPWHFWQCVCRNARRIKQYWYHWCKETGDADSSCAGTRAAQKQILRGVGHAWHQQSKRRILFGALSEIGILVLLVQRCTQKMARLVPCVQGGKTKSCWWQIGKGDRFTNSDQKRFIYSPP